MSETLVNEKIEKKIEKSEKKADKRRQRRVRLSEIDEFRVWLEELGYPSAPKVHVNGVAFSTAVIVVDFGTPLVETVKLTAEQSAELISYIRNNTKSLFREREVTVRVQNDSTTGVWWSNVT
jgi:hypothetical protein